MNHQKPYVPRLKLFYQETVVKRLKKKLSISNDMNVPRLIKVVLSMGLGKVTKNSKIIKEASDHLTLIACQKSVISKAKASIAGFSLREGMPIGCFVTLRGKNMYDFLDRFLHIAMPRIRDFKGLSAKSFDGLGNYNMGIKEHIIFPEINIEKTEQIFGCNISVHTSTSSDAHACEFLKELGFPLINTHS